MTAEITKWARDHADVRRSNPLLSAAGLRQRARDAFLRIAGSVVRPPVAPFLRCLYMHHVYDDQVGRFRQLLAELLKIGSFISSGRLHDVLAGRGSIDGRQFHLSIDDGFDNVHRNAFPIMKELGVTATIFVPTRFIGASDAETLQYRWSSEPPLCPTRPLAWDDVREMRDAGFDIGAHTRHHVRLSEVSRDPQRLADELQGAKQDLESALGQPCRNMSWPYGTRSDVDDTAMAAMAAAGYEMCFSAVRGRIEPGRTSRLAVPRHHFEPEWPWSHVRYFALGGRE